MVGIVPQACICDLTHMVRPFGVREGALVLAASVPFFPGAVHLAVVDPGVGSRRRPLVLTAGDGSVLVGPDNGLLIPAAERLGGVLTAHELTNPALARPSPSPTFHGRDIFAPAAAHLARGVEPGEFGPEVIPGSLKDLGMGRPVVVDGWVCGEVLAVDRFGNLQTSVTRGHLPRLAPAEVLQVRVGAREIRATFRQSYAFGPEGELQVVEDSRGFLALSVNLGDAAAELGGVVAGEAVAFSAGDRSSA